MLLLNDIQENNTLITRLPSSSLTHYSGHHLALLFGPWCISRTVIIAGVVRFRSVFIEIVYHTMSNIIEGTCS